MILLVSSCNAGISCRQVCRFEEFLELPVGEVVALMSADDLGVKSEEQVRFNWTLNSMLRLRFCSASNLIAYFGSGSVIPLSGFLLMLILCVCLQYVALLFVLSIP